MPKQKRSRWGTIDTLIPGEKYRIRWSEGKRPNGKRRTSSMIIYGTWDDADVELMHLRVMKTGVVDRNITYELYWRSVIRPSCEHLESKTKNGYDRVWTKELSPVIGDCLERVTTYRQVCVVIDGINAPSVQRAAHALWKKICNMARHDKLLTDNPVDRTVRMKPRNKRKKIDIPASQFLEYLELLKGTRYQKFVVLEAAGGLRHEEATPIGSDDISEIIVNGARFAAVKIDKALVTVDGRRELKGTKTEGSVRTQLFAEPFASILLDDIGDGPLFPGRCPKGEEMNESWYANPQHVSRNWRKWCERNEMKYVRFADMRTIYSDRHAEAGSLDSLVQLSMGHDDGSTRGRNYQTGSIQAFALIASNLAEYLKNAAPKKK